MHYMNDYYELALVLCGLDYDNDQDYEKGDRRPGDEIILDTLEEKYGITEENFCKLMDDLMPYAHASRSDLTDEIYTGFADHKRGMFLAKKKSPLIGGYF